MSKDLDVNKLMDNVKRKEPYGSSPLSSSIL